MASLRPHRAANFSFFASAESLKLFKISIFSLSAASDRLDRLRFGLDWTRRLGSGYGAASLQYAKTNLWAAFLILQEFYLRGCSGTENRVTPSIELQLQSTAYTVQVAASSEANLRVNFRAAPHNGTSFSLNSSASATS